MEERRCSCIRDSCILRHFLDHSSARVKTGKMIRWEPVIPWSVLELGIRENFSNTSINKTIAVFEKVRPLKFIKN